MNLFTISILMDNKKKTVTVAWINVLFTFLGMEIFKIQTVPSCCHVEPTETCLLSSVG